MAIFRLRPKYSALIISIWGKVYISNSWSVIEMATWEELEEKNGELKVQTIRSKEGQNRNDSLKSPRFNALVVKSGKTQGFDYSISFSFHRSFV